MNFSTISEKIERGNKFAKNKRLRGNANLDRNRLYEFFLFADCFLIWFRILPTCRARLPKQNSDLIKFFFKKIFAVRPCRHDNIISSQLRGAHVVVITKVIGMKLKSSILFSTSRGSCRLARFSRGV